MRKSELRKVTIKEPRLREAIHCVLTEAAIMQLDREYLQAVQTGDMAKAMSLVKMAFKQAFPATKVVDENGEPRVVYHGTNSKFNVFDEDKVGDNFENVDIDYNFFFTANKEMAHGYGKYAMPVFLNIVNPKECKVQLEDSIADDVDTVHDTLINAHDFGTDEIVVSDPPKSDGVIYTLEVVDEAETSKHYANHRKEIEALLAQKKPQMDRLRARNEEIYRFYEPLRERAVANILRIYKESDTEGLFDLSRLEEQVRLSMPSLQQIADGTYSYFKQPLNPEELSKLIELAQEYVANDEVLMQYRAMELGIIDDGNYKPVTKGYFRDCDIFAVDHPSQIKSAAVVVYDDRGNIIPLSQRFTNNNDIRYEEE